MFGLPYFSRFCHSYNRNNQQGTIGNRRSYKSLDWAQFGLFFHFSFSAASTFKPSSKGYAQRLLQKTKPVMETWLQISRFYRGNRWRNLLLKHLPKEKLHTTLSSEDANSFTLRFFVPPVGTNGEISLQNKKFLDWETPLVFHQNTPILHSLSSRNKSRWTFIFKPWLLFIPLSLLSTKTQKHT